MKKYTLRWKILTILMLVSLVPLSSIFYVSFAYLEHVNTFVVENTRYVAEEAIKESTVELQELGERVIEQKSRSVANEIHMFLGV